ncbi:hypothetical protein J3459_022469 [Metarhizium acridum]|uniref:uncharacterized protein n=1 Tax=Metarhizium acridum TaxID=92637 RepID=UPI001C6C07D6|nr:hypothetical protein J3458_021870 [Metarhizium acridum]KAG8420148.1 hypothetical protein J3459_022469 [Metarhizium acridum]
MAALLLFPSYARVCVSTTIRCTQQPQPRVYAQFPRVTSSLTRMQKPDRGPGERDSPGPSPLQLPPAAKPSSPPQNQETAGSRVGEGRSGMHCFVERFPPALLALFSGTWEVWKLGCWDFF